MIAYTRAVPSSIVRCELTHLSREPLDIGLAVAQHEQYEEALRTAGVEVRRVAARDDLPDSVFVEDTAVVVDELAVVSRPGSLSRRDEVESVREALATHRTVASIEAPATLDGGDVLVLDREVLVGLTLRTNLSGMQQLRGLLAPFGYTVRAVPVHGCLHLKSAVTRAGERTLVANPSWFDPGLAPGWNVIPIDAREPFAANALWLGRTTIVAEAFPHSNAALRRATDSELIAVAAGELAKAEGGVTCCSILVRQT